MTTLAALALATPLFGFALTPPDLGPLALDGVPVFAQLDDAAPGDAGDPAGEAPAPPRAEEATAPARPWSGEATPAREPTTPDPAQLAAALRQRQDIATVHRAFGIATWGAMLVTVVLGAIQYHNLYGFFGSREDTPCVAGGAVFGQDQCWGTPWPHRVAALTTTALYTTNFVLSIAMPDPLGADTGPNAEDLRIHKALRWVHFGGMIAQVLLGFAVGQNWFGLDRANDFEAQRALATVHQLVGLTTFGVLTAAGAIMLF